MEPLLKVAKNRKGTDESAHREMSGNITQFMGLQLTEKVRAIGTNLDITFILMVFRAKSLDKINLGKTVDRKQKRTQNWQLIAIPKFRYQEKEACKQNPMK